MTSDPAAVEAVEAVTEPLPVIAAVLRFGDPPSRWWVAMLAAAPLLLPPLCVLALVLSWRAVG